MPFACVFFRPGVTYRAEEFGRGLRSVGFDLLSAPARTPAANDLLVLWNRKPADERVALAYGRAGATILVAENGYINGGDGRKRYALSIGHHNGAGKWREGGPERFDALQLDLHHWRRTGSHILVLPQRGIGEASVAMPSTWGHCALKDLATRTGRRVVHRRHPGATKGEPYEQLVGAHAAVTWGSGAGIKALAAGVPVFYDFARWIGAPAATPLEGADLEAPLMDDSRRLQMFRRLAWAQWTIEEISSGEAFRWLLRL